MKKLFLDPKMPISTCQEKSCEGCGLQGKISCHFNGKQLAVFLAINLVVFLADGYFIFTFNPLLLIPWILFIIAYFGFIEIRVMCSHCPHYAEPSTKTLKCWANYGSPKLWKYRPGPMSFWEKLIFISGLLVIALPPIVILFLQKSFIFLIAYIFLLVGWKIVLGLGYCSQCMNFACPLNITDDKTRQEFMDKNEIVREAYISSDKNEI